MGINSNTIAFVTGGAQGIGRSFTEHLLANGAKVAIGDLKNSVGPATKSELDSKYPGKIIFVPCDVTNEVEFEDAIKTTISKFGNLNLLINNAGICDETDKGWPLMMRINADGVVRGTKLGFKYMGINNGGKGGTIINVASITCFIPWDIVPAYSATKAFVNQFCLNYGTKLHYDVTKVKVISINPGLSDTAIISKAGGALLEDSDRIKNAFGEFMKQFPLQTVDNMGRGLITVLQKGNSGSMWVIENNEDAREVKLEYKKV